MTDRRSFFKSLALIGAAAVGCPGIFIPKFESVRWKKISAIAYDPKALEDMPWPNRDFAGKWVFTSPYILLTDDTVYAIKPLKKVLIDVVFHKRE